jgi:protein-tyrosine phosphatase
MPEGWFDIHCHLVPAIDDGATDEAEAVAMAELAHSEGTSTIVVTPHQLGNFRHNSGSLIRERTAALQELLNRHRVGIVVLPGADVRIESDMPGLLASGEVLSLGDHRKHVLLELPHDIYFPLAPVMRELEKLGMTGILSHPERNRGIQQQPELVESLVDAGCLMQVTCGSLMGSFGPGCQQLAERWVAKGLVHFLATDAHGAKARRPLFRAAFNRATELAGQRPAELMCREHGYLVAHGRDVPAGRLAVKEAPRDWRFWRKAG